jgi:hypothetical protein
MFMSFRIEAFGDVMVNVTNIDTCLCNVNS